ncbi:DNA-binding transcriptional regulator BolA [Methylobacterium cerastii]|uniref:DNA-binding transcriptional regulator BolA n=1 Tax=Methylobacterium cerastii TaxID=932741 RepID=A0ABQ4QBB7_9HYPH|nr:MULTISPECIES: BolA family protein [Methylobacterium]TXM95904.1 BolA family transcriptional regulator [Methylobacterium sp. WL122]TXM56331.1 BolA family transcriptional regulator [Methylobacterium sp. WL120]TXM73182.1 BolA family transcriptional regulator [Methylobacterium sp. WL12]TXM89100.1 BolA family transcriptional regulator [Methylobacterium sp. WL103]TXN80716.1 BolA family transcriptional regulator [Methylobacterium sp. WL8]
MTGTATLRDWIEAKLAAELAPARLDVVDESHLHAGHSGARPGGETHFRVDVVSDAFEGKSRVDRHRVVNALLAEAFARGLHALAVKARTPSEAG